MRLIERIGKLKTEELEEPDEADEPEEVELDLKCEEELFEQPCDQAGDEIETASWWIFKCRSCHPSWKQLNENEDWFLTTEDCPHCVTIVLTPPDKEDLKEICLSEVKQEPMYEDPYMHDSYEDDDWELHLSESECDSDSEKNIELVEVKLEQSDCDAFLQNFDSLKLIQNDFLYNFDLM